MAATIYKAMTKDGDRLMRRTTRQGAPTKPDDIKQNRRVMANLTPAQRAEFDRQKPAGMKDAAFAAQLICLQLFATNKS